MQHSNSELSVTLFPASSHFYLGVCVLLVWEVEVCVLAEVFEYVCWRWADILVS
jgi:hypothetical protein